MFNPILMLRIKQAQRSVAIIDQINCKISDRLNNFGVERNRFQKIQNYS